VVLRAFQVQIRYVLTCRLLTELDHIEVALSA
jgi:hypothetical protein